MSDLVMMFSDGDFSWIESYGLLNRPGFVWPANASLAAG
jgi:hypothetical protein